MFFRFRPVQLGDLEECFDCIRDGFAFREEGARQQLQSMWRELLQRGMMTAAVIEDRSAPLGQRIVWFCSKVYLTDTYAHSLIRGELPPLPSRQIFDLWRCKQPLPLLSQAEIRRINSVPAYGEGVTLLVLHYGAPSALFYSDRWLEVAGNLIAFTEYFTGGYRTRELLEEFYEEYTWSMAQGAGFTLRTDYAGDPGCQGQTHLGPQPRLYGVNATEANALPGTLASAIFRYQPPRFFFKLSEQELLLSALLGDTDEETSAHLNVAYVTIKKRWQGIYERVEQVMPEIFTVSDLKTPKPVETTQPVALPMMRRGPEKRRYLLTYLRHHFEELRPVVPRESHLSEGNRYSGRLCQDTNPTFFKLDSAPFNVDVNQFDDSLFEA